MLAGHSKRQGRPLPLSFLVHAKEAPWGRSDSSLSSENPYATIKDCPGPAGKAPEGSYMEMKSPPSSKREKSYAEISLFEDPSCSYETKEEEGAGEDKDQVPPTHFGAVSGSGRGVHTPRSEKLEGGVSFIALLGPAAFPKH